MENTDLTIRGDLLQFWAQENKLSRMGISCKRSDVYRIIPADKVIEALTIIWVNQVEGWWHYKEEFIKYDICSAEDWKKGFEKS